MPKLYYQEKKPAKNVIPIAIAIVAVVALAWLFFAGPKQFSFSFPEISSGSQTDNILGTGPKKAFPDSLAVQENIRKEEKTVSGEIAGQKTGNEQSEIVPEKAPEQETLPEKTGPASFDFLREQRQKYGIPLTAFALLPLAEKDFTEKAAAAKSIGADYTFFSGEYFIQPEFYPSFPQNAVAYWQNPGRGYYGAIGYGFFPAEQKISLSRGETRTARFFVHSGYGIETWQGARVIAVAPENGNKIGLEIMAGDFLLEPNYPKFLPGWAKAIDARITAKENAETGNYYFKLVVAAPSEEKGSEWGRQYSGKYFNASAAGQLFAHTIEVEVS